ncbi:unnamed protein product, partial [Iphiclides podalirius]
MVSPKGPQNIDDERVEPGRKRSARTSMVRCIAARWNVRAHDPRDDQRRGRREHQSAALHLGECTLDFQSVRPAIRSRNCLNNFLCLF